MIKRIRSNAKFFKQLAFYFENSKKNKPSSKYQNILFCPLNGSQINTFREVLIGRFCKEKGVKTSILFQKQRLDFSVYYTGFLHYLSYLFKVLLNGKASKKMGMQVYYSSSKQVSNKQELFNKAINEKENFVNFKYRNVLIGDLVMADTIRHFQCFGPMWDNDEFMVLLKKAFFTAIQLTHSYENSLQEIKPDKLIMSHGIYTLWGILFRIARAKNIPVDVYGGSYRKNTLRFYHNVPNAPMPMHNWKQFEQKELTKDELEILDPYIISRENQSEDNISLFNETNDKKNENLDHFISIAKKSNSKICTLYTNIAWDAYSFSGKQVFSGMEDWLRQNITFFINHPNHYLIIKAHPAETYFKVPEEYRIKSVINQIKLTENIIFLDEHSTVKPFELYPITDIGLINISTVAIEMALENRIVLTSGSGGQYADKEFTIDPESPKDYFDKLTALLANKYDFKPNIEIAKRYMYFRFFREAIPFDLVELKDIYTITGIKSQSKDVFLSNPNMKIIVEGILNDKPFMVSNVKIDNN